MLKRIAGKYVLTLSIVAVSLCMVSAAHAQATLTISLTLGADVNGEPQYTATVTNTSNLDAPNLTVTFTLPKLELPISPPPSGGCLFTPGPFNLTVVCSIPNLNPNQSHDFVIAVHPISTEAQDVTAVETESGGGTASAFITSNITGVGLTEMQVTMSSTNPGKVGEALVYNVTVTNIQDDDAQNVLALLAVPRHVTLVSATRGCVRGALIACSLGTMSPGTSKTVTVTVLPRVSGWTQATAGVSLTTPDGDPSNNSAATSVWVNP